MCFVEHMTILFYIMGEGSQLHIMLNEVVSKPIPITKCIGQGCPLQLLLFAMIMHLILTLLSSRIGQEEMTSCFYFKTTMHYASIGRLSRYVLDALDENILML